MLNPKFAAVFYARGRTTRPLPKKEPDDFESGSGQAKFQTVETAPKEEKENNDLDAAAAQVSAQDGLVDSALFRFLLASMLDPHWRLFLAYSSG